MFIYFIAVSVKEKSIKITKICSHCFFREIYIKAAKSVSFNFEGVYCTCKISWVIYSMCNHFAYPVPFVCTYIGYTMGVTYYFTCKVHLFVE